MFSIEDILSQGDKDLKTENFSDHLSDQCFLSEEFVDLGFLDSITEKGDPTINTINMNLDLKVLLADVLAGEPMDISLLNINTPIPDSELSYNLNYTTVEGDLISVENDIPGKELSCDLGIFVNAVQHQRNGSVSDIPGSNFEVSGSAEVSSSTNTLFDLLDEGNSLGKDILHESGGSEITESVAGKKYLDMRRKNNIASQKSRKIRKQKNSKMVDRLKELEKENKELSRLADVLEKERNTLQELLLSVIAKKS